jgi:hypothetical protein
MFVVFYEYFVCLSVLNFFYIKTSQSLMWCRELNKFCLHEKSMKFKTQTVQWIIILPVLFSVHHVQQNVPVIIVVGNYVKISIHNLGFCVSIVCIHYYYIHINEVVYDCTFTTLTRKMWGKLEDEFMNVIKKSSSLSSALQTLVGLGLLKKHFRYFKTGNNKSIRRSWLSLMSLR